MCWYLLSYHLLPCLYKLDIPSSLASLMGRPSIIAVLSKLVTAVFPESVTSLLFPETNKSNLHPYYIVTEQVSIHMVVCHAAKIAGASHYEYIYRKSNLCTFTQMHMHNLYIISAWHLRDATQQISLSSGHP